MKISTEIDSIAKITGEEKAVELVARAGFDAWDFTLCSMAEYNWDTHTIPATCHPLAGPNYLQFCRKLRKIGEDLGIHCNQSHAPIPSQHPEIRPLLKRAIECTAEAGGKICIIHPDNTECAEKNAEMYLELLPFAKQCGVKIAAENLYNWEEGNIYSVAAACSCPQDFQAHLDAVNDDFLVACVDVGHAEMRGSETTAPEMIRYLGSKMQALHIHDNDHHHDSHELPFEMQIDFKAIMQALKDINYNGYLTLEACYYLKNHGYTVNNVAEGVRNMAKVANRLRDMYNQCNLQM